MEMRRNNILFSLLLVGIILLVVIGLFTPIYDRTKRAKITVEINPLQPIIALTFDDGPPPLYTPQILDILYDHQVPATFFVVGEAAAEHPLLIKEMAQSGHEIECHTFSHPDLTTLSVREIQWQIDTTEATLQKILTDYSTQFVRPPYGRYTEQVQSSIKFPLVLWTIDSSDWMRIDAETIEATVVNSIQNGDVIVFHDDNKETVKALDHIISQLKSMGFQFVTVSQLLDQQPDQLKLWYIS